VNWLPALVVALRDAVLLKERAIIAVPTREQEEFARESLRHMDPRREAPITIVCDPRLAIAERRMPPALIPEQQNGVNAS
jgi:hypothetical protein